MTPDFIAPDPRDSEDTPDVEPSTEPAHRVKVYDGLVVDPMGDAGTIGADANGD